MSASISDKSAQALQWQSIHGSGPCLISVSMSKAVGGF